MINKTYLALLISFFGGMLTYHVFLIQKAVFNELKIISSTLDSNITEKETLNKGENFFQITIQKCNDLFAETTDNFSIFHPSIKNKRIKLYKDKEIIVDDILYGYDLLFEREAKFASSSWLGIQAQQDPSDAFLIQMLLWEIKPDLIIDLGTNTGGSAIFFASIMNYYNPNGKIISIDIKNYTINWYNGKSSCKKCSNPDLLPLWKNHVTFYQGSTMDPKILFDVEKHVNDAHVVFISQDTSHDASYIYAELKAYSKFVTNGSYILVQDTKLDRMLRKSLNSISYYIDKFISENDKFIIDRDIENTFYFTHHPKGYLKRIKL